MCGSALRLKPRPCSLKKALVTISSVSDMQDIVTNWRRHSDEPAHRDERMHPSISAEPPRILIVDSDIQASTSLELMLHALGYSETRVAYSGHAGLAVAEEFAPSVALLELDLLDMSGYEVARLLREHARCRGLRLIALTCSSESVGRELARISGFERYLTKPVASLDLQTMLDMQRAGAE